jgi:acyl carrier protein
MIKDTIINELNVIFCDIFDDASMKINTETTANDVEGWDSLSHMMIITMVEKHYNIKLKLREVMGFESVGDFCNCIESKIR